MGDVPGAFNRMANDREFDICEMPIVSYLVAKDRGIGLTAIPAFVTRGFDHRRLFLSEASGVADPADLEGRSVGVRYYGFTDGTWARAVLAATFGVDLDKVTWVTAVPETVLSAELPPNVRYVEQADPVAMFESGELAGLILNAGQDLESPVATPLFADPVAAEMSWFRDTSVYPIHHTVVVKDELLTAFPDLAATLMNELTAAKAQFLTRLESGAELDAAAQALGATREFMGEDPLPYGVEANRATLEMITKVAFDQHLIRTPMRVEDAFPGF
jgi:4,5-dihydroxyphthalate decarboxylase